LASFSKCLEKILSINVIVEDVFPTTAPAHDMVKSTGILNPDFPWHRMKMNNSTSAGQSHVLV
jgi:hypothetical protein